MAVHYIEEDRKASGFGRMETRNWLHEVIRLEGKKAGVINFIFCSDEYLVEINKQFLKRDYFTDVISFDYTEDDLVSGDIMISVDRVKENAINLGVSFPDEMKRIMVHGVLHLIGYDDATDEMRSNMSSREDLYLARVREQPV